MNVKHAKNIWTPSFAIHAACPSECSYANPTPTVPWGKGAPAFVYTCKQRNGSAMAGVKTRR